MVKDKINTQIEIGTKGKLKASIFVSMLFAYLFLLYSLTAGQPWQEPHLPTHPHEHECDELPFLLRPWKKWR